VQLSELVEVAKPDGFPDAVGECRAATVFVRLTDMEFGGTTYVE